MVQEENRRATRCEGLNRVRWRSDALAVEVAESERRSRSRIRIRKLKLGKRRGCPCLWLAAAAKDTPISVSGGLFPAASVVSVASVDTESPVSQFWVDESGHLRETVKMGAIAHLRTGYGVATETMRGEAGEPGEAQKTGHGSDGVIMPSGNVAGSSLTASRTR